jgi:hypothetical protein
MHSPEEGFSALFDSMTRALPDAAYRSSRRPVK